ncbi:hypothetical protein ACFWYW_29005 [Nonomuraea sp. NPDC059023]|uniref:hypothetical protein n=1 Tax=unclassified Nonomuraea TaxID=2593643 RepID=UPI0036C6A75C
MTDRVLRTWPPSRRTASICLLPDGLASAWRLSHATTIPATGAVALCHRRP